MTDMGWHLGRSWFGTALEDSCPCPKEPCGLVLRARTVPECPEHPLTRYRTIRQAHPAYECPGKTDASTH